MRAWSVVIVCLVGAIAACGAGGGEPAKVVDPKFAEVASIHKANCGRCHRRVEPGLRTHEHLEDALRAHRKRVTMSEENWSLMIDYLAAPPNPNLG